jgi:ABC-type sulfate transport system permease component
MPPGLFPLRAAASFRAATSMTGIAAAIVTISFHLLLRTQHNFLRNTRPQLRNFIARSFDFANTTSISHTQERELRPHASTIIYTDCPRADYAGLTSDGHATATHANAA